MTDQVNPILRLVQSRHVIALHSAVLGDIVDSKPQCCSDWRIVFGSWSINHESGRCWPYSRHGQWTSVQITLQGSSGGDLEREGCCFESKRTQVSMSYSLQHRTLRNAGDWYTIAPLWWVFFIIQDMYIISHTKTMRFVCWKLLPKKRRFLLSSLESPQWALEYIFAAFWVIPTLEPLRSW